MWGQPGFKGKEKRSSSLKARSLCKIALRGGESASWFRFYRVPLSHMALCYNGWFLKFKSSETRR